MRYLSVAVFLVAICALLLFLLRFFTQMGEDKNLYTINAFFEHTGGVNKGNPIKMVGHTIGAVKHVQLDNERRGIHMQLNIHADVKIPKNSKLKVAEKGMLGEMYLYFTFGDSKELLQPGDEVVGTPPVGMADFMSSASGTIEGAGTELTAVLQKINSLMGRPGFSANIAATVAEAPVLLKNLSGLANDARPALVEVTGMIKETRPVLNEVLVKLKDVTGRLNSTMAILDEQMKGLASRKTMEKLDVTVDSLTCLLKRVDGIVKTDIDPAMDDLGGVLKSLNATLVEVNTVAKAVQPLLAGLGPDSKGSLSKMVYSEQLSQQIGDFLGAGTELMTLLEEQPNSIIFGKRKKKTATNLENNGTSIRRTNEPFCPVVFKSEEPEDDKRAPKEIFHNNPLPFCPMTVKEVKLDVVQAKTDAPKVEAPKKDVVKAKDVEAKKEEVKPTMAEVKKEVVKPQIAEPKKAEPKIKNEVPKINAPKESLRRAPEPFTPTIFSNQE